MGGKKVRPKGAQGKVMGQAAAKKWIHRNPYVKGGGAGGWGWIAEDGAVTTSYSDPAIINYYASTTNNDPSYLAAFNKAELQNRKMKQCKLCFNWYQALIEPEDICIFCDGKIKNLRKK